jgi:MFS family permease
LPTLLTVRPAQFNAGEAASLVSISALGAIIGVFIFSTLAKYGRRKVGVTWAAMGFILALPIFYGLVYVAAVRNFTLVAIIILLIGLILDAPYGVLPAYLSERFPTSVRGSGVGFGFNSGYILGAWFSLLVPALHGYFTGIEAATVWFSTAVVVMMGAALFGTSFYLGPETIGRNLSEVGAASEIRTSGRDDIAR